jgi:hypothetical protein
MLSLIFGGVVSLVRVVAAPFFGWLEKRAAIKQAEFDVKLARLDAEKELQLYRLKADLEWDLQWSQAAEKSWKDEFLLILWSLPFILAFVPWTQGYIDSGFTLLTRLNADAAYWYFASWAVIFSAVFGMRAAMGVITKNSNIGKALDVMTTANDDIPEPVAAEINKRLAEARKERAAAPGRKNKEDR